MFNIVPAPFETKLFDGFFEFTSLGFSSSPLSENALLDFTSFCKKAGIKTGGEENVIFVKGELGEEEYTLSADEKITVTYGGAAGAFYALQTLKQLLLQSESGKLQKLNIKDRPRFAYRGMMLDVGRYFYTVDEVKRFIDMMAVHKLNTFHFHLTEDQGWRIEIKKYPLLTEKGSKRSHTNFGIKPHGGFYTQEEIREIVAYAHSKYIKVIPEFDIPGHTMAAIACYPELACFPRKLRVKTHWGVKHDILCAGKPQVYEFVYNVIDELIELFPDKVIHIGGDEAFKMRWDICPRCQKLVKENSLANSDELQQIFMNKIDEYIRSKGYSSVMWNWDLKGDTGHLEPSVAWTLGGCDEESCGNIQRELERGRNIISTQSMAYYLDLPYGWVSLEKTADFDPTALIDDSKTKGKLLGLEAPLWTEYVPNMKKADYMLYPRLGAFCMTAWSQENAWGWKNFKPLLEDYYKLLDFYGAGYAKPHEANPSPLRAKLSGAWFNRRQLHWEGLHNLVEDAWVKLRYGKNMK